ncbi:hypothetical protein AcV5_001310 [Taiwanofungus camphoratus]|nr:hypothetical protein AcV5_001310 [Antrodia cinnamomea]
MRARPGGILLVYAALAPSCLPLGLQFTGGSRSAGVAALRTDDAPGSLRLWTRAEDPIASGAGCPTCPSYVVPANASSKGWWSRLDCASCFLHALASARRSSWFPFLPPALAQSPGVALGLSRAVHTGLVIYMIMTAVRAQRVSKVESTRPTSGLFQAGQLRRSHPWLRTCQNERLRVAEYVARGHRRSLTNRSRGADADDVDVLDTIYTLQHVYRRSGSPPPTAERRAASEWFQPRFAARHREESGREPESAQTLGTYEGPS